MSLKNLSDTLGGKQKPKKGQSFDTQAQIKM